MLSCYRLPDLIFNILPFFMLFLISCLIALYFLAPSAVSCLPFFSALRSLHISSMLVVTHGLLTVLRLPKISLAVSVIALLKEFTSVSTSVSSALSKVSGAKLPPIIACICNLRVFERCAKNRRFQIVPCNITFSRAKQQRRNVQKCAARAYLFFFLFYLLIRAARANLFFAN